MELSAEIVVDGMRVRLDSDEHAEAVSAAARDLGLAANPAVLQHLSGVFESANPTVVRRFWQRVLDYAPGEDGGLEDPLRRDPAIRIRQSTEPRPLRNRIHLDVVRPAAAVDGVLVGPVQTHPHHQFRRGASQGHLTQRSALSFDVEFDSTV